MGLFRERDEWSWWEEEEPRERWGRCSTPIPARRDRNDPPVTRQKKDRNDYVRDGKVLMAEKGVTPLDYLQAVMEGAEEPTAPQMQAAVAILPYRHKKMPVAVENTGADGGPIATKVEYTWATRARDNQEG